MWLEVKMLSRLFLSTLLLLATLINQALAAETIVGDWKCTIGGFDEQITFSDNNTYKKATNILGLQKIVQTGQWRKDGDMLYLMMEYQIDRSGKLGNCSDYLAGLYFERYHLHQL